MRAAAACLLAGFAIGSFCHGHAGETIDEVISSIKQSYSAIDDYQVRFEERSILKNRREERVINFYFKRPKYIRMDILRGNRPFDRGSVGVYTGGDKVSGQRGGALKGIVIKVSKDSPLATTIRGVMFDESDLDTVLRTIEYYRSSGEIRMEEWGDSYVFTCTTSNPAENGGISRDVVWIDRVSLLITRNERYEGDALVQAAAWSRYIINAGLPEALFDARFDAGTLAEMGIPTLSREP